MRPRITVITAVLNQADKLEETIKSVLAFNYPDLDYIVIDGGSTEGTLEVIESHSGRLKHWISEPDQGVYDAMNKGWQEADPESWIIFLGAGDELRSLPWAALSDNPRAVLYGNVLLEDGKTFHACSGLRLKLYNSLHHQALLIPKSLHRSPPFDLTYPRYADFDFNQRLQRQGAHFCYSPELVSYASPAGLTRELDLLELTAVIAKNYGWFWSGLSTVGFSLAKCLPLLKKLRPIH